MIKDEMNLPLGIDTQYIKSTGGVFTTATDAEILPYTIGYIPFSMLDKARIFKNMGKYTNTSVPNVSFRTIRQNILYEPTKGVPFVYTIKTIQENKNFHGFYDTTGNTWNTSFIGYSNTNLRALHSYNTNHFVNDSGNNGLNVTGVRLIFVLFETLGNGGWGGTSPRTVAEKNRASVSATFSAVTPDIVLSFSTSVSSSFGSHTYTIDNSIFNAMDENGVFQIDGGTYSSGGTDFERHLFGAIEQIYVETSGQNLSTNSPGFGVIIADNFRNSQTLTEQNHTNVRNTYGTQSTNYLVSANECMYLFDSQYGYFWEYALNDVSLFRFAVAEWINCPVFCGATWDDILICICTALPAYKINNAWYVTEFTDDYYITGKLIPYEDARDWQKNINGDTNEFNPADIPEPVPPGEDDTLDQFSGSNIFFNLGNFGATNGFITHWVMTRAQVSNFGTYVWQNLLDFDNTDPNNPVPLAGVWENLKVATKTYFTTGSIDPASLMQLIVGLRFYPFDLNDESTASADNCIYFGTGKFGVPVRGPGEKTRTLNNMAFKLPSTSIVLPSSANFWYKDFRDYEGCTAFIYLPFCGTYQIPISEIVPNTQFDIDYEVDLATGSCTAYVSAVHPTGTTTGPKTYPIIVANGQCGFEVPLSATNANRLNATIIADAQKVVGAIAGPINESAGKVISGVTSAITGGANIQVDGLEDIDVGGLAAASVGPMGGVANLAGQTAMKAGGNLVNVAAGMATRSGCAIPLLQGGRGWSALGNPLKAYLQIRRGRYMYAKGYEHSEGRPENRQLTVSDITGFFQCDNVDMSGVGATSAEVNMIKRMLETGVYHK